MKSPTKLLVSITVFAVVMGASTAASAYRYTDENGRHYECRDEQVTTTTQTEDHTTLGTLGGAALGGLAGNQFGKGSGKTAATAAGAVAGGLIGHNQTKSKTRENVRTEKRCHRVS
jgi:uncharacterized protein YcfJ